MSQHKWIVAHRGQHSHENQNTMAAFREAMLAGADMIEFDVRRLADGALVVLHDDHINGSRVNQLTTVPFYDAAVSAGIAVPVLAEVCQFCAGRILLDIELKDFQCEADVLLTLFEARVNPEDFILTSFDADQLARVRQANPGIRTGLLTETRDVQEAVQLLTRAAADYLAPEYALLDEIALEALLERKIRLLPWTVNSIEDLSRLLAAPAVVGVITDRVDVALELRKLEPRKGGSGVSL